MSEPIARPTDAELHAYKAWHHALYMRVTAEAAEGTNRLIHTTELPTEGTDPVVTPALDHLYSKAVIDLTVGPVVVELPRVPDDRYFSIHVTDEEHYTIYDEVRPHGTYVFVRRGRGMPVPPDATVIECAEDYPHLFLRVQLRNDADKPNALEIQSKISIAGESRALTFDDPIQFVLDTHDFYPKNAGLLESVVGSYGSEDQKRVEAYANVRAQTIENNIGAFGPIDSAEAGSDDPEIRATAIIGHLGLPAEHAIYLPFFVNCQGEMLMGDRPEVFRFPYEPENVREFWSVTRYSLSTRNTLPGLNDIYNAFNTEPEDDGYVTITFSAQDPHDGTYWMPVIDGEPYYFIVRYYGPDLDALPPGPCD